MNIDLQHAQWDLSRMQVAPENPRFGRPVRDLDSIAATIRHRGLLQPLIGYFTNEDCTDFEGSKPVFHVVAGARRLAALQLLSEQGQLPDSLKDGGIPVRICDRNEARDAGLIEQTQRVNLHPAEEAAAYQSLIDDNQDTAAIANAYGVSERFVKQRLKLSGLYAPIFAAFRDGQITIDVAAAYAAGNDARQNAAWDTFGADASSHQVRNYYRRGALPSTDNVALFVGEKLYKEQGGAIDQDLFNDEGHDFWLDVAIAENAARAKLEARCAELRAEGWSFAHCALVHDLSAYAWERSQPKRAKPTEEQKARLEAIKARLKVLDDLEEQNGFDGLDDEQSGEYQRLHAEQEAIDDALDIWSDRQKSKSGVFICVGPDGQIEYHRGLFLKEDRKAVAAAVKPDFDDDSPAASHAGAYTPPPAEESDTSIVAHQILTNAAGAMVGRALQAAPFVAIVAITAHFARKQLSWARTGKDFNWGDDAHASPVTLAEHHRPNGSQASKMDGDDQNADDAAWLEKLKPCKGELEQFLFDQGEAFTYALLAHLTRPYIRATEDHPKRPSLATRRRIAILGRLANAQPEWFAPDVELLKGFTRGALDDAASEMGLDVPAGMKKGALAQLIADKAAALKWQPPLVREMIGAPKYKRPKASAESQTESIPSKAKNKKASKAGGKPKAAKPAQKPKSESLPKAAKKTPTTNASGRVLKIKAKVAAAEVEITGKKKRGRPSNAELAARAAAEAASAAEAAE